MYELNKTEVDQVSGGYRRFIGNIIAPVFIINGRGGGLEPEALNTFSNLTNRRY